MTGSRHARQIVMPGFGAEGQARLKAAKLLVVGAGGLGSPCLMALAAAGVGVIGVCDDDRVAETDLNRQTIHDADRLGMPKTESAAASLARIDASLEIRLHSERLTKTNARELIAGYDLVADCTDGFPARFAIAQACEALRRPLVTAAVTRMHGTLTTLTPYDGVSPRLGCLHPDPPSSWENDCAQDGVLGAAAAAIGALQAAEAIKLIVGPTLGEPLIGRLLMIDLASWSQRVVRYARRGPRDVSPG